MMSAFLSIAASIPSWTVSNPRLSMISYPAQAKKFAENCERARRIARLPMVSMNTLGRFPEVSVARRSASKSLAARFLLRAATEPAASSLWHPQPHPVVSILSWATSVKLGNWFVPRRDSLRFATSPWRFFADSLTASWIAPDFTLSAKPPASSIARNIFQASLAMETVSVSM